MTYSSTNPLPPYVIKTTAGAWILTVRAQPGAKKTACAGLFDKQLRVRIAAPAVENKANKALIRFLAKTLQLKAGNIALISGETSRTKKFMIKNPSEPNWSCLSE